MGTRLFVGNLPYSASEQDLREALCQKPIPIRSVRVALDRDTGRPRGFAFVEVETEADAQQALTEWAGLLVGGRPISIAQAHDRPAGPRPPRPEGPPRPMTGPPVGPRPPFPPRVAPPAAADDREEGRRRTMKPLRPVKPKRSTTIRQQKEAEEVRGGKWRWDGSTDY